VCDIKVKVWLSLLRSHFNFNHENTSFKKFITNAILAFARLFPLKSGLADMGHNLYHNENTPAKCIFNAISQCNIFGVYNEMSNDNISISLDKNIYEKYEPINFKFFYINKGDEIDTIYDRLYGFELDYFLKDANGNFYGDRFRGYIVNYGVYEPHYLVRPGDTLKLHTTLNNYVGKELKENI